MSIICADTPEALETLVRNERWLKGKLGEHYQESAYRLSPECLSLLGQHFSEAVSLRNKPPALVGQTIRIGFLGITDTGKTTLTNGIIWGEKHFEEKVRAAHSQLAGESDELGFVVRADCKAFPIYHYRENWRREKTFNGGRLELLEHVQEDPNFYDKLHALFFIKSLGHAAGPINREVRLFTGAALAQSPGFEIFERKARHFLMQ